MNPQPAHNFPAKPTVLSLRQLHLTMPVAGQVRDLIKGIDLDLRAGEMVGLVGESGCGKSLTGNALLGLLPSPLASVHSQVFVLGDKQDLAAADEKAWRKLRGRHLAMIFQEPQTALDPVFTIGQQMVRVIRRHVPGNRQHALDLATASLADCGLGDTARILASYPHQLSGGMRQRAMIAMALSCKPEVLIADEPTSALDISSRDQILTLLRQAADRHNTAILLISHDLAAVARVCDRALVMYSGRVLESGPTARVLNQPQHPYTAALMQATPRISKSRPLAVQPIQGRVEALHLTLPGCAYAARCPRATELCSQRIPELKVSNGNGRAVACHHPLPGAVS